MSTELNLATSADWPNSATAALRLGMAANADALRGRDRVLALAAAQGEHAPPPKCPAAGATPPQEPAP